MPLKTRQHPTHYPELAVPLVGAMPGNRQAIGSRAYVPGITHGRLVNVCGLPVTNDAATGWHLTPHGSPDEKGALIRFPRYAYVVPDQTVNVNLLMTSAATAYDLRTVRGARVLVGVPIYETMNFSGAYSTGIDPTSVNDLSMLWMMQSVILDPATEFEAGDLFVGSVAWNVPVFIETQFASWTPPDPEPAYVTGVPPGCSILETLNTNYIDSGSGTHFKNQLRLLFSGNTQAAAQAIADTVIPRFRRFQQRYYYIDGPIGGPGIQSDESGTLVYLASTFGSVLTATTGGFFDAVSVGSLEAAGGQAVSDADLFFS